MSFSRDIRMRVWSLRGVTANSASVLVGVLWCMALVAVVVIGVLHTARLHLMIGKNYTDKIQARYLALAGIEKAKALLYEDAILRRGGGKNHTGQLYDSPEDFREISLGPGKFSVVRQGLLEEGGGIIFGVADEESRLSINQASSEELGKINGLTPDTIAAIVDWKDEDSNVSPAGAESDYYLSLKPPYMPRNGPFLSVNELLMVRGISAEFLFGEPPSPDGSSAQSAPVEGVADYLTADGWTVNVSASGESRINVQNADAGTLTSVRGITSEIAQAIVSSRGKNKIESLADLLDVTAQQNRPGSRTGSAANEAGPKVISEELFLEIADSLTTDNTSEQRGLVNINTASAQVLTWLPGMTPELAQEIVSYRTSNGFFSNIAWLLKVPGMSRDIFKRLSGRVTARSENFRIISQGTINSSGVRERLEVIVHIGSRDVNTLAYKEGL